MKLENNKLILITLLVVFLMLLFIKKKQRKEAKKNIITYVCDYITIINKKKFYIIFLRLNTNRDYIKCYKINKDNKKVIELKIFIDGIPSDNFNTSIVHNFTVYNTESNYYIANAGRDQYDDINYDKGHDEGMYFFKGNLKNDIFHFESLGLQIKKETGGLQTHPGSNECYTPIIKIKQKFFIYCRYNVKEGERKVQIFESFNGLYNWKLYDIVSFYDTDNKLLDNVSIYLINISFFNNKLVGMVRLSKNKTNIDTEDKSYNLYYILSDDGVKFKLIKKIINGDFWPCYGSYIENNKLNLFILERFKNYISKVIIDKSFNYKIVRNVLKL